MPATTTSNSIGAVIYGDPAPGKKFSLVFSGHHLTIRCDGNSMPGAAFGGLSRAVAQDANAYRNEVAGYGPLVEDRAATAVADWNRALVAARVPAV